ncbi:hypothetical protein JCM9957A_38960 [Kineosporia succinea]
MAGVLALTLAGCGSSQAGAAAVIGDRRIPVSDVQDGFSDVVPLVGQDAQITQAQILNLLILEPYLSQAAASLGRGVSDADAKLDIGASGVVKAEDVSEAGLEVWKANMANTALQTDRSADDITTSYKAIEAEMKKAGVHINPRYGDGIDYSTFSITQSQPDWLAGGAETPAAEVPVEEAPADGATP